MLHLEAHELGSDPEGERAELAEIYERKGVPAELAWRVANLPALTSAPDIVLVASRARRPVAESTANPAMLLWPRLPT